MMHHNSTRVVITDVDGVLTDGTLVVGAEGECAKIFNARDGVAVGLLQRYGIRCGVVSGKASAALDSRVADLGFDFAETGVRNKRDAVAKLMTRYQLERKHVVFIGDDVMDLAAADLVADFFCPADAHPLVIRRATHVLGSRGGRGVLREAAELVLDRCGIPIVDAYQFMFDEGGEAVVQ